jgi:hypothetical protein
MPVNEKASIQSNDTQPMLSTRFDENNTKYDLHETNGKKIVRTQTHFRPVPPMEGWSHLQR